MDGPALGQPSAPPGVVTLMRTLSPRYLFILIATLAPLSAGALTPDEARHLLVRTGFDASPDAVTKLAPLTWERAVQQVLNTAHEQPLTAAPTWINDLPPDPRQIKELDDEARKQIQKQTRERAVELKTWWYREMLNTDSPLTEHMTLFWHNHFTSSMRKVKWPAYLYRQNLLLRRYALGNYRDLLHTVAHDPAMLVYLDGQQNRREKPNENFARELLELFTLGEGHYTERDIKEAARAFTGWMVDRRTGEFQMNARQHDGGEKNFLGRRGKIGGDEVIEIILEQPRAAEFIVQKLWREFVSDKPDPQEIDRLATLLRNNRYEMRPLMQALLTSPAFRDPANRGALVKSPVELLVGTARQLQIPVAEPFNLARAGIRLGQDVFDPPNVKGWPGGQTWITSNTLLARRQILEQMLRGAEMGTTRKSGTMTASMNDVGDMDKLKPLLLPLEPVNPPTKDQGTQRLRSWILDPVYQLK